MKMVKLPTVDTESVLLKQGTLIRYKVLPGEDRWFNIEAVQSDYLWSEQPEEGERISIVILANGSFLTSGTPEKISGWLNSNSD